MSYVARGRVVGVAWLIFWWQFLHASGGPQQGTWRIIMRVR